MIAGCFSASSFVSETSARNCALLLSSLSFFNSSPLMSSKFPCSLWKIFNSSSGRSLGNLLPLPFLYATPNTPEVTSFTAFSGSITSVKSGLVLSVSMTSSICSAIPGSSGIGSSCSCISSLCVFKSSSDALRATSSKASNSSRSLFLNFSNCLAFFSASSSSLISWSTSAGSL